MTFKYGLTLPVKGSHKLARFRAWAQECVPDIEFRLPPQAPTKTETLTIRLRRQEDISRLRKCLPDELP